MKNELSIIMPVYNESEAIGPVLDKWLATLNSTAIDYAIHVYNDGSRDNTLPILHEYARKHAGKVVIHDKPNSGHGPTILLGYRENCASDWIFQVDSDDELGPDEFMDAWKLRENHDFVIGYRQGRKSPLSRSIVSRMSRTVVGLFYGWGIADVNSPYRLYRNSAFAEFFNKLPEHTFAPNVALAGIAALKKLRIAQIPVQFKDRTTGEASIKKWKLIKAAFRSFGQTIAVRFTI